MGRRFPRHVVGAMLLLGAIALPSACVLFSAGASGLETTSCTFQGQDTTVCGQCVAASCQAAVNVCCEDGTCSSYLTYLDACASTGDSASCTLLGEGGQFSGSASYAALGACVIASCPACNAGTQFVTPSLDASVYTYDATPSAPAITCTTEEGTCYCDYDTPFSSGTATSCTPASFPPNGICCADQNYPKVAGTSCTCSPFTCNVYSSGCVCSSDYDPESSQDPSVCEGMTCCPSNGICSCSVGNTCDSETEVSECLPDNTGCSGDQVSVTYCLE